MTAENNKKSILIVEDESIIALNLKMDLEDLGYEVINIVDNGDDAIYNAVEDVIYGGGGWDGFAITEDLNLSVKLMIEGYAIRYCGETWVYQEAVPTLRQLFRQRARWAIGNFETLFIYGTIFPGAVITLTRDRVSLPKMIYGVFGYWLYCFHLIPLFFITAYQMLTRKERTWAKTVHTGDEEVEEVTYEDIPIGNDKGE